MSLVSSMIGHESRVMDAAVAPDGSYTVASVSYDRTVKLWLPESRQPDAVMIG